MSPPLPIETIEHTIDFLDGDLTSIAACSLVCRTLLPACRALLWRDITAIGIRSRQDVWLAKLSELLKTSPNIRSYVRSFTLDCGALPNISVQYAITFCKLFPSLRCLTLCYLPQCDILSLLSLIDTIPSLEELHLPKVAGNPIPPPPGPQKASILSSLPPLQHLDTPSSQGTEVASQRPHLTAFSVVSRCGISHASDLLQLVSVLEHSRHSSSLRSLDLRAGINFGSVSLPLSPQLQVPSFAPQLTHFGIVLLYSVGADGTTVVQGGHENMLRTLSDLPRCRALRSLSLQFDCSSAFGTREFLRSMHIIVSPIPLAASPSFIDAFSDVLGAPGAPPFPELERLSLVFLTSLDWLSGCGPAFERLAHLCLNTDDSGRRCYPRISRLDIRVVITGLIRTVWPNGGLEKARARFEQDKENMLLPMLASFVQGGIAVDVIME